MYDIELVCSAQEMGVPGPASKTLRIFRSYRGPLRYLCSPGLDGYDFSGDVGESDELLGLIKAAKDGGYGISVIEGCGHAVGNKTIHYLHENGVRLEKPREPLFGYPDSVF